MKGGYLSIEICGTSEDEKVQMIMLNSHLRSYHRGARLKEQRECYPKFLP